MSIRHNIEVLDRILLKSPKQIKSIQFFVINLQNVTKKFCISCRITNFSFFSICSMPVGIENRASQKDHEDHVEYRKRDSLRHFLKRRETALDQEKDQLRRDEQALKKRIYRDKKIQSTSPYRWGGICIGIYSHTCLQTPVYTNQKLKESCREPPTQSQQAQRDCKISCIKFPPGEVCRTKGSSRNNYVAWRPK